MSHRPVCVMQAGENDGGLCYKLKRTHTSVDLPSIALLLCLCQTEGAARCPPFESDVIQMTGVSKGRSSGARGLHGSAVIHHRAQRAES